MENQLNAFGMFLYHAGAGVRLDSAVKTLLSYKPILANILKETVTEFSGYTVDEIIPMIDSVHTERISVETGLTNDPITGENRESKVPGEGETKSH